MKIQFIKHSCFVLDMPSAAMIFDYSRGELPDFDSTKPVYVFISHVHSDHFNPEVLEALRSHPAVRVVASFDIPTADREKMQAEAPEGWQFTYMNPYETAAFPEMAVSTLKSTDEGVAFLIEIEGKTIYFAGDLHWWTWPGDVEADEKERELAYKAEIERIKDRPIDVAFLVLDPRQEDHYSWGFDYFMQTTQTAHAFPMHSWGRYHLAEQLLQEPFAESYKDRVIPVHGSGEIFTL